MHRTALACALALSACCKPATPPATPTSSGSLGIITVTVNGKEEQKLYVPQQSANANGQPTIAVLDAAWDGQTGKPLLGTIALTNHADQSFATATAAGDGVVVAVGYQSVYVDLIDPTTDAVTSTVQLPASVQGAQPQASFSGGGGLVNGVVVDPVKHRAILAVTQGFLPLDLTTHEFGAVVPAAPAENFGFWPDKGWVLAPFYDCPNCSNSFPAEGLQIVDMNGGKSYLVTDADGGVPFAEPDSADVDTTTGVVVVPDEGGNIYGANFESLNPSGSSVTATYEQSPNLSALTGVAIDPVGHHAFLESEAASAVAVLDLPSTTPSGALTLPAVKSAQMPNLPDNSGWVNAGDPHGLAVSVSLLSGNPVGFLEYTDGTWVARIDLDGFANAPVDSSGTVAAKDFNPLVTLIPALPSP